MIMTKQQYRITKSVLKKMYQDTKGTNDILSVAINIFNPQNLIAEARAALEARHQRMR